MPPTSPVLCRLDAPEQEWIAMAKRLFEQKLEWGNPARALRFGALLVASQATVAFAIAWFRSTSTPIEAEVLLRLFRRGGGALVVVAVVYGMHLVRSGIGRERWVGAGIVACSVVAGLSILWLSEAIWT
jgi:hypothetical protein